MYHGTDLQTSKIIIQSQRMESSRGDHHWLGDGIYFYRDAKYAFRWIAIKYTANFKNSRAINYKDIFQEYAILTATINSDRVLDLDNPETKMFVWELRKKILEKSDESERLQAQISKSGITDGVIINILFEKMGFKSSYDYVSATFPVSYSYYSESRLNYIPELQICVKNAEIIENINNFCVEDFSDYQKFIDLYKITKQQLKKSSYKRQHHNNNITENKYYTKGGSGRNEFKRGITKNQ